MSILSVENVSIGYEGKPIVENINFKVEASEYVCIVGENGAGKSTFVKTLMHLRKPLAGTITYEEDGIGYLPQQTFIQRDFPASVWEIVLSGNIAKQGLRPFYNQSEKNLARANMEKMGIWDFRHTCYRNLSGGQQQRVLLARALCASSKILVLDEPTAGLDPKVTQEFYDLLSEIHKEGITIIMVSHDIGPALKYSDHILHIGKDDVFYGKTDDYVNSALAKEIGVSATMEEKQ